MIDRDAIIAAFDAGESGALGDEMRTLLFDHGAPTRRVVVLYHGLTASPAQWRGFARDRYARGETVLVPRLPRHGHANLKTRALAGLTVDELRRTGSLSIDAAAALGEEIVVVGLSLGGTLALEIAQRDRRVARTIGIAPFLDVGFLRPSLEPVLRIALGRLPNAFLYWDPIRRGRGLPQHGYPRYATRALAATLRLAEVLEAQAHRTPAAGTVEIIRNENESSVSNAAIDRLVARWRGGGAANVRVHRLLGLPKSHDIVEPGIPNAPARLFLPKLHDILDAPPPAHDQVVAVRP